MDDLLINPEYAQAIRNLEWLKQEGYVIEVPGDHHEQVAYWLTDKGREFLKELS